MCRELKLFRDFMILNLIFLLAALPFQSHGQASPAVIYQGSYGKIIPGDGLRFRDNTTISTGSIDPTSTAFDAPSGSLYISTGTGLTYQKQDAGETTNWNPLYFVPVFTDDDRLVKTDGTSDVQQSGVTVSDTDQVGGITQLDVDDIRLDGFAVSTTATDQSLELSPNGTGTVDVTYLSDSGSAVFTGANGALNADFPAYRYSTLDQLLYVPGLQSDNVQLNGNTVSTTNTDGDLILSPNGTGEVQIDGFAGGQLLESSVTGGIVESSTSVADVDGKLEKFPTETNDNILVRTDTDGNAVQGSGISIDDSDNVSGANTLLFNGITEPAHQEGLLFYDSDISALSYYNDEAEVTMNVGEENWVQVRNNTGATITDGSVVYVSGATGLRPEITLAQANSFSTSKVIGVATHDIEASSNGYVTTQGIVRGLDTSSFTDGDLLYLSPSVAGEVTTTAPTKPDVSVLVGRVINSHLSQGKILVTNDSFPSIGFSENAVPFGNSDGLLIENSTNFLYNDATDLLRVGGFDLEAGNLTTYGTNANLGIEADGTGVVNITSETNIENLNFSGSSITGTSSSEDLTLTAEATRDVKIEDLFYKNSEIFSTTATPITITPESTQPVNIDDVDIQDNTISASVTNDDLELAGDGTGRVKIDRGGTLYEAGSRNPEYVELIDDPSFQAGVSEWSCTDATVEQVTNASASNIDHGVDRSATAAKITVTADGGYCEIVKTIGTSQAGTYVPSIYYASSSANAFIEFARDSRARVVDELDFINSGDYEFISAQLIASTGLSIRLGGNNTDVIHADMASMELGGYNRSASKNCSGVLDCENRPGGYYDTTTTIKLQQPDGVFTGVSKTGGSNENKSFTVASGVFSETPKCRATGADNQDGLVNYRYSSSTPTLLAFDTELSSGAAGDVAFMFECTKAPADYKTTEDKGVTIIPDNKDARLVVTNEGTTTNQTIGSGTITVAYDTVKSSQYIEWDTGSDEGTFQAGGTYKITPNVFVSNVAANASFELFVEVDSGTGYAQASNTPKWGVSTNDTDANRAPMSNPFQVEAEKGDKFRVRVTSNNASSNVENTAGFYPTLDVTPLGGGKAVVENSKRVEFGVEQFFGEYYGGEKVYQYCNEVATEVTTTDSSYDTTLAASLEPVEVTRYAGNLWLIDGFSGAGTSSASFRIEYDSSSGNIGMVVGGSYTIGAGTVYCMRYKKP